MTDLPDDPRQTLPDPAPLSYKARFGARLRGYFLAGILVTAPITITVYLTYLFVTAIDRNVVGLLPVQFYETPFGRATFPGLGLIVALVFFVVAGWFATNILGRFFIRVAEFFVQRMPVIRTLYRAIKQIFETVMTSQSEAFRECVLVEYPKAGVWALGFVTGRTEGEIKSRLAGAWLNVFVPTSPNPTSGYLLFVPEADVKKLEMSVEEGLKMVVSAGILTP